jgi:hypothetical protein
MYFVLGPAVPLVNVVVVVFICGSAAFLLLIAKPLLCHEFFAIEFTTFDCYIRICICFV